MQSKQHLVEGDTLEWYDALPPTGRRALRPRGVRPLPDIYGPGFGECKDGAGPIEAAAALAACAPKAEADRATSTVTLRSDLGTKRYDGGVTLRLPSKVERVHTLRLGGLTMARTPPVLRGQGRLHAMTPVRFKNAQTLTLVRRAADGTELASALSIPPTMLTINRVSFVVVGDPNTSRWVATSPHGMHTLRWPAPRVVASTLLPRTVEIEAVGDMELQLDMNATEAALASNTAVLWTPPLAAPELFQVMRDSWTSQKLLFELGVDIRLDLLVPDEPGKPFKLVVRNAPAGDSYVLRASYEASVALGMNGAAQVPVGFEMYPPSWTGASMGSRATLDPVDVAQSLSWATGFRLDASRAIEACTVAVTDAVGTTASAVLPPGVYSPRVAGAVLAQELTDALTEVSAGSAGVTVAWTEDGLAHISPGEGGPPSGELKVDMSAVPELAVALGFDSPVLEGSSTYTGSLPRPATGPRVQLGVRSVLSRFSIAVPPSGGFSVDVNDSGECVTKWGDEWAVHDIAEGDLVWLRVANPGDPTLSQIFLDKVISSNPAKSTLTLDVTRSASFTVGRFEGALGPRIFPAVGPAGLVPAGVAVLNARLGMPEAPASSDALRGGTLSLPWALGATGPISLLLSTPECSSAKGRAQADDGTFHDSTALLYASPRLGPGVTFEQDVILRSHVHDPTFCVETVDVTLRGPDGAVLSDVDTGGFVCTVLLHHEV